MSNLDVSHESDESSIPNMVIYTPNEIMKLGLRQFYTVKRIKRAKTKVNIERFVFWYGAEPKVAAQIFEDLQRLDKEDEAYLPPDDSNIMHFLMSLHHLKRYPKEMEREALFDIAHCTGRDLVWFYLEKVQGLKKVKIFWPDHNYWDDIWVITVDGIHCWINEPRHPEWSQDSRYFSHKYGKAGLVYELGIAISESRLVWMRGPCPAGESDRRVFRTHGLKDKLQAIKKMGIADNGYTGYPELLSTPNDALDSRGVKKFKSRALKRHENFNNLLKQFNCLDGRFRHREDKFKTCFESCAVISQYKVELTLPLYDVYIEDLENVEEEILSVASSAGQSSSDEEE